MADLLLRARFASIWWPRVGLEVASFLLIALGGLEGLAAECALATLPAVLLTSSLTSHGAALQSFPTAPVGVAINWLHILGATAWVGGLVGVMILLPASGTPPGMLSRLFRFALVASILVTLSGVVQATLEVGAWSALSETTYGQLVLVKVGLLIVMLLLAGLNERRLRHGVAPARGMRLEVAVGLVVLAVAAMLSGTPPARV
jgi:copper transport protein